MPAITAVKGFLGISLKNDTKKLQHVFQTD